MISYDLVMIRWKDIQSHDGPWMVIEEIPEFKPVTVETVGWIITDHEQYVTIVSTLSDDQTFTRSVCSIPRGCIESIKTLGFPSVLAQKSDNP